MLKICYLKMILLRVLVEVVSEISGLFYRNICILVVLAWKQEPSCFNHCSQFLKLILGIKRIKICF